MANRRNPESDQVISCEFEQYFAIDIVLEERDRVLFEPQVAQPLSDLDRHHGVPRSPAEASPPMALASPL
jgi:hypothetical protein